jgi:amino acid permease
LPGQLLNALADGGTNSVSYSHALISFLIYAVVTAVGTLSVFRRQDV